MSGYNKQPHMDKYNHYQEVGVVVTTPVEFQCLGCGKSLEVDKIIYWDVTMGPWRAICSTACFKSSLDKEVSR